MKLKDDDAKKVMAVIERARNFYYGKTDEEITLMAFSLLESEINLTEKALRQHGRRIT